MRQAQRPWPIPRGAAAAHVALALCVALVLSAAGATAPAALASQPPGAGAPLSSVTAALIAPPSRRGGATTALIAQATIALAEPGRGRSITPVATATAFSQQPQRLLVLSSRLVGSREWLRVLLPIRPDGSSGWIPRNDAVLAETHLWITLDLAARVLLVYRSGKLVHRFAAVVGKAATPTPSGLAAIYERNRQPDPSGFLGPWALPLTVLSHELREFGGGPGRIAIHGRDGASLADPLGSARSHGCIRIEDAAVGWLAENALPGTPVQIRR